MPHNFFTFAPKQAVFVFLLFSFPTFIFPNESCKKAQKELIEAQEKITQRFTIKLTQSDINLEACVTKVKRDALYNELETALQAVKNDPVYKIYRLIYQTHTFINELEKYNKSTIRPDLLIQINTLLDQLKNYEKLTSVRSTLKKQRVALLELFEEKDLILSVEKILKYQNKELSDLITTHYKEVVASSSYQHLQQIHTKYLASSVVQKLLACIEKKREILLQQQNALFRNKNYQKALYAWELCVNSHPDLEDLQTPGSQVKKELLKLQTDLFLGPLDILI
jgi:hypothetical protein